MIFASKVLHDKLWICFRILVQQCGVTTKDEYLVEAKISVKSVSRRQALEGKVRWSVSLFD